MSSEPIRPFSPSDAPTEWITLSQAEAVLNRQRAVILTEIAAGSLQRRVIGSRVFVLRGEIEGLKAYLTMRRTSEN